MQLTILMPCYNEEGCIESVVLAWLHEISRKITDFEMLIVDDGSRDRSPEILDQLASQHRTIRVLHQKNSGHGAALLAGLNSAKGDWVFHTDSDGQSVPSDFWLLWDQKESADYLLGFRLHRKDPIHRLILTRTLRLFIWLLLGTAIRDINIPFKLVRRDVLDRILKSIPAETLAPSIMMAIAVQKNGMSIRQIGVQHLPRTTGKTVLRPWKLSKFCLQSIAQVFQFTESCGR